MGIISKLILPRQIDFDSALQAQAHLAARVVQDLYDAFVAGEPHAQKALVSDAEKARQQKNSNMKELLNVFITPYDKESIFRLITQLDWVAVSGNHLKLLADAYSIDSLQSHEDILLELTRMAGLLDEGISQLSSKTLNSIAENCDRIHDKYDQVVSLSAHSLASLLLQDEFRTTIMYRDILAQMKEIAKRIHVAANTIEDMMIKVV